MAQLCARAMYATRPSFHFNSAISGVGDYFSLDGKNSLASLSVPASQLSSCVSDVQKKLRAEGMRLSMVRVREMEGDGGALRQNLPVREQQRRDLRERIHDMSAAFDLLV